VLEDGGHRHGALAAARGLAEAEPAGAVDHRVLPDRTDAIELAGVHRLREELGATASEPICMTRRRSRARISRSVRLAKGQPSAVESVSAVARRARRRPKPARRSTLRTSPWETRQAPQRGARVRRDGALALGPMRDGLAHDGIDQRRREPARQPRRMRPRAQPASPYARWRAHPAGSTTSARFPPRGRPDRG
jgi:hypothetical protein